MTKPDQFNELAESWTMLNRAISSLLVTQPGKMTEASEAVETARARHESLFALFCLSTLRTSMAAPGESAEAVASNAGRYEHVRKMSPRDFSDLYAANLKTGVHFDQLVDEQRAAAGGTAVARAGEVSASEHPPLGSMLWFSQFAGAVLKSAQAYVNTKHPVTVYASTDAGPLQWVVAFVNSDFWADAFEDKASAEAYAAAWNNTGSKKTG
jgi:hypothetical protein